MDNKRTIRYFVGALLALVLGVAAQRWFVQNRVNDAPILYGIAALVFVLASWKLGRDGQVYNLADDEPHRTSEFANLAADLHGIPRPRWVDEAEAAKLLGEPRLRRKLDSKRVSNRLMKEELEVILDFPSYRTGLPAAVLEEMQGLGRK